MVPVWIVIHFGIFILYKSIMTFFKLTFRHLSHLIMELGPLAMGVSKLGTKQSLLPSEVIS